MNHTTEPKSINWSITEIKGDSYEIGLEIIRKSKDNSGLGITIVDEDDFEWTSISSLCSNEHDE